MSVQHLSASALGIQVVGAADMTLAKSMLAQLPSILVADLREWFGVSEVAE